MPTMRGVIHGRQIDLSEETGLPEGQEVNITLEPVIQRGSPGQGIRESAGAWATDAAELDKYLEWNRLQRKVSRPRSE